MSTLSREAQEEEVKKGSMRAIDPCRLPSSDPLHTCGMYCDGQDGSNSHCARERAKITCSFGKVGCLYPREDTDQRCDEHKSLHTVCDCGHPLVRHRGSVHRGSCWDCTEPKCHGFRKPRAKDANLSNELCALLSKYVGETGKSEGAVEVLRRLLDELKTHRDKIPGEAARIGRTLPALCELMSEKYKGKLAPGVLFSKLPNDKWYISLQHFPGGRREFIFTHEDVSLMKVVQEASDRLLTPSAEDKLRDALKA